jgi:predicted enzyme related to lactoylglutathione lyase
MALQLGWLTLDARDPRRLAAWWQEALDLEVVHEYDDGGGVSLCGRGWNGSRWNILFFRVHNEKTVKNRLHLDLLPDDQEEEVRRLERLGARRVDIGQRNTTWVVMADPEGNEFCVLRPQGYEPEFPPTEHP